MVKVNTAQEDWTIIRNRMHVNNNLDLMIISIPLLGHREPDHPAIGTFSLSIRYGQAKTYGDEGPPAAGKTAVAQVVTAIYS